MGRFKGTTPGPGPKGHKRLRNLFNRITVDNVIFDAPIGPEILQSSPEGKFQTQIRVTFEIFEDL